MTERIIKANQYIESNKEAILQHFKEFLAIPSISSDPNHMHDLLAAANWVKDYLSKIGMSNTTLLETTNHPVVYGDYQCGDKQKPTILIYGHYDVQPPDPLDLWESDPFVATIKDGLIIARGASDMKGQIIVFLSAIEALMATGNLDVNLKFMIEGEEEIGSPSIESFLEHHKERFSCDFVLNLDAGSLSKTQPSIVYGLRGLAYFEIHITGPDHDLHSGLFGGVVFNPVQALANILSAMIDEKGKILLPGFYDDVLPVSDKEKIEMARLGLDDAYYLSQTGAIALVGEEGFTPTERIGARPTLDVNGIIGGFTGVGPKTIIPSKAMAKISMRLVPNQTPRKVYEQLLQYLEENAPKQITWQVKRLSGDSETPYVTDPFTPQARCFAQALESVWNVPPIYQREGGSIPIASNIQNVIGASSILSGFALPDDKIHSPNERMDLDMFWKGIRTLITFFHHAGEVCE
jgi:acetylornithine deacetylase/succinyl-diaminopimelate desuccinylase-like protein